MCPACAVGPACAASACPGPTHACHTSPSLFPALQVLSDLLLRASLSDYERSQIERLLSKTDVCTGACERILRTAMQV